MAGRPRRSRRRRGEHRPAAATRATRRGVSAFPLRWLLLALILLAFGCVLLVDGLVYGNFAADGRVAHEAPTNDVPASVQAGGPIIATNGSRSRSLTIPTKTVILTFDDGPDPVWTPRILSVLKRRGVTGTFFAIGSRIVRSPRPPEVARARTLRPAAIRNRDAGKSV